MMPFSNITTIITMVIIDIRLWGSSGLTVMERTAGLFLSYFAEKHLPNKAKNTFDLSIFQKNI